MPRSSPTFLDAVGGNWYLMTLSAFIASDRTHVDDALK